MIRWSDGRPRPSTPAPVAASPPGGTPGSPLSRHRIEFLLVMNKRFFTLILSLTYALPLCAQNTVTDKAREIHNSALVVDTHADTPQRFLDENYDIGSTDPHDNGHIRLDKAKAGNL